jgi:hypothetical protein
MSVVKRDTRHTQLVKPKTYRNCVKAEEGLNEEEEICPAGISYVLRTDPGGKDIKRGKEDKDGDGKKDIKNWSMRAAMIASNKCKNPDYGTGKSTKKEGAQQDWLDQNWVTKDGVSCGGGGKDDHSDDRCKPASEWAKMSPKEKEADDAKKKRGTKKGKQYVKSDHPVRTESKKRVIEVRIVKSSMKEAEITKDEEEELEDVSDQLKGAVKAHGKQADTIDKALKKEGKKNCGCGQDPCKTYGIQEQQELDEDELEEKKKKKKPCKKAKGKKFVKRVNGRCRSFGQAGKAKDGGPRIRPGTEKAHRYCARSAGIKKCKNPPCANTLSRKKWKCQGKRSVVKK